MLEEKNDNLPSADGIQENNSQDVNNVVIIDENESSIDDVVINEVNHDTQAVEEIVDSIETVDEISNDDVEIITIKDLKHSLETDVVDTDSSLIEKSEVETIESNELTSNEIDLVEEHFDPVIEENEEEVFSTTEDTSEKILESTSEEIISEINPIETELIEEVTISNSVDGLIETENNEAISAIDEVNAEENEDDSFEEESQVPMKEYESLTMEQLFDELSQLNSVDKVATVKNHVEEVRKSFLAKYYQLLDEKKAEFFNENPESTEEFQYNFPLKNKFDQLYNQYRDRKNAYFQSIQDNLKNNLKVRLGLVEELKNLVHNQESIPVTLKKFNDIRDRWKIAGPIPKDKYNHVWNNYHFHLENFYDILHLDREIRDLDFKHNLVQKLKIIERLEELVKEDDINKSFRELQVLHKVWKEQIGPVSREHREETWNRFSELTRQLHDKREQHLEKLRAVENENLEKKNGLIAQITVLSEEKLTSHAAWQKQLEKVEILKKEFFATGRVPQEVSEEVWTNFKTAIRNFEINKNSFYKEIKKEQNENLAKKQALIERAKELKDSDDFLHTTPLVKQIQEEWKQIGHVPRKLSDQLWAEFRGACNEYFERLKENKNEELAEEILAFEKKKEYLETIIKEFQLVGDYKTDLDAIKAHIETWKTFGKVPSTRRHIEGKFNKMLDGFFDKLSASKKDNEMLRYANKLDNLANSDSRKLDNEKVFITKKIDEVQSEIFQLENNIQFFSNSKPDNPMVIEVTKNIESKKEELATWKEKLKQLKNLKTE